MKNFHTQKGFVVPLILSIIALLAIGGGIFVYKNKKVEKTVLNVPINVLPQISTTTNISNGSFIYTNSKYGFTLTFPESWKEYVTSECDGDCINFGLPSNSALFNIDVYKPLDWKNYEKSGQAAKDGWEYLAENNKYIFVWGYVGYNTENEFPILKQIPSIISTFKFISASVPTTTPIVGGDKDIHGCIGSAGYLWCVEKSKCIRPWEEKCEVVSTSTDKVQCKTDNDCMEVSCPGTGGFAHEMCISGKCIFAPGVKERCTAQPSCNCPSGYIKEGETCNPACYYSNPKCLMPSIQCSSNINVATTSPVACTMDAMMCPDGSYVGRSAPDCKFICPAVGENSFCGGIAGIRCAPGLICKYDGIYPDAGGKCITEI